MEQYREICPLLPWEYAPGCPVIIAGGRLVEDADGQKLALLTLENLSSRQLAAVALRIECMDFRGEELEEAGVTLEEPWGPGEGRGCPPCVLPDAATELIRVRITRVEFPEGDRWEWDGQPWEPLPPARTVEEVLQDPRDALLYRQAVGEPCVQAPRMHGGLFICACGTVNMDEEQPCRRCGRTFPELARAMNPQQLARLRADEDQKRRKEEAACRERKSREARTRRKEGGRLFLTAVAAVALLGLLAWLVPGVVMPFLRSESTLDRGISLMDQGQYQQANETFLSLGDYKNAPELALEALYRQGEALRAEGRYRAAADQFLALGDYADSAAQAELTLEQWKEADYQAARELVESGAYPAAAAAFEALGDYKDAAQWVVECRMLQREGDYDRALAHMEAGRYSEAIEIFAALGEYRDCGDLEDRCRLLRNGQDYAAAKALLASGDYAAAEEAFAALGSYEDAPEKLLESRYALGCRLLKEEDYAAAVEKLSLCGDYQNTDWSLKQAKMGYARTHPSRTDEKTLSYLKELKDCYFQGAKALYDEIFGWKVEITAFSNSTDPVPQETLSKFGVLYVHFELSGGEPGQTTTIRTTLTVPGGNMGTIYHTDVSDGYYGYTSFWFDNPEAAPTGTLTFQAYDESGKLLCTGSVKVTR